MACAIPAASRGQPYEEIKERLDRAALFLFPGFFHAWCIRAAKPGSGKTMSVDDKKTKTTAAKKEPAPESKAAETAPKTEAAKTEAAKTEPAKPDAAPANKGMGEGQKPVSQAYKDNWNAIFAKKKKR
jgi:hypothetical protein